MGGAEEGRAVEMNQQVEGHWRVEDRQTMIEPVDGDLMVNCACSEKVESAGLGMEVLNKPRTLEESPFAPPPFFSAHPKMDRQICDFFCTCDPCPRCPLSCQPCPEAFLLLTTKEVAIYCSFAAVLAGLLVGLLSLLVDKIASKRAYKKGYSQGYEVGIKDGLLEKMLRLHDRKEHHQQQLTESTILMEGDCMGCDSFGEQEEQCEHSNNQPADLEQLQQLDEDDGESGDGAVGGGGGTTDDPKVEEGQLPNEEAIEIQPQISSRSQ